MYSYLYHIYFLLFQFYLKISISLVKKERRKRIDEELFASKVFQMGEIQLKLAKKKKKNSNGFILNRWNWLVAIENRENLIRLTEPFKAVNHAARNNRVDSL